MIKISTVVENIILSSEEALFALSEGFLNYSAYANKIKKEVEQKCKKPIKKGSIVVALSRLSKNYSKKQSLIPKIFIKDLTIKSPLIDIVYKKDNQTLELLNQIYQKNRFQQADFITITQGISEITFIASESIGKDIMSIYKQFKPKSIITNLVALCVKFDEIYLDQPNIIYGLIRNFAIKKINIVEIVSTYSELAFIIENKNLQKAFTTLNNLYQEYN